MPDCSYLPIQYAKFAAWQRDHSSGASGESLHAFWVRF